MIRPDQVRQLAAQAFVERLTVEAEDAEVLRKSGQDEVADRAKFKVKLAVFMAGVIKP